MTLKELWQTILGEIELGISKANFITWFKNTKIHSKKDGVVTIGVPNGFTREWLENKYNKLILKILRNNSPDIKEVQFIIEVGSSSPTISQKNYHPSFLKTSLNFKNSISIRKQT